MAIETKQFCSGVRLSVNFKIILCRGRKMVMKFNCMLLLDNEPFLILFSFPFLLCRYNFFGQIEISKSMCQRY
jgi:hypothetical protein